MTLTGATEKIRLASDRLRLPLVAVSSLLAAALGAGVAWGMLSGRVDALEQRARLTETCVTEVQRGVDRLEVDVRWIRSALERRAGGQPSPP